MVMNYCGVYLQLWFEINWGGYLFFGSYVYVEKNIFIFVQMQI